MKNYFRIGLYGDSLSMARPGVVSSADRYFYKLLEYLQTKNSDCVFETIQRSKASISAPEIYSALYHDSVYYDFVGDICIFQLGVVDCAPRPIETSTRLKIDRLPNLLKSRIIKYLHNNRRKILLKGRAKYVTSENDFRNSLKKAFALSNKLYKKIFVINICPTNDETEYRSPGLSNSIVKYNEIIAAEIKMMNSAKFQLIDIYNYIEGRAKEIDKYVLKEDGHHITPLTHEVIFQEIKSFLNG